MPRVNSQYLASVLVALARRHPLAVVLAAGSLAVRSLFLTVTRLEFHTNRADLIFAGDRYKQRHERDRREFAELPEVKQTEREHRRGWSPSRPTLPHFPARVMEGIP